MTLNLAANNNSQTHYAKGTLSLPLLKAPTDCRRTVSGSISLPSPGFFSPFPHGTSSLSVIKEYLGLADGPAGFAPDACVLCYSGAHSTKLGFRLRVFHPLWMYLPVLSANFVYIFIVCPTTPTKITSCGLASFDFARRYFQNHSLIFFS